MDNSSTAGKVGFIDESGNMIITPRFNDTHGFSEGLAAVQVGDKWGFINKTGQMVIKPIYDNARNFSKGKVSVQINSAKNQYGFDTGGTWIMIDNSGKLISSPEIDSTLRLLNDHSVKVIQGKWQQMNGAVGTFSEGLATKQIATKWKFIDKNGADLQNQNIDYATATTYGYGSVAMEYKSGYIDTTGNYIIPTKFDNAREFKNGTAEASLNHKWGVIDKTGNFVIAPQFDWIRYNRDGLSSVRINGKWGFIDNNGKIVIPIQYDDTTLFSDGLAPVWIGGPRRIKMAYGE